MSVKQSAKKIVKTKYPHAFIDSYEPRGSQTHVIYTCHESCQSIGHGACHESCQSIGYGRTEEEAWADAVRKMEEAK